MGSGPIHPGAHRPHREKRLQAATPHYLTAPQTQDAVMGLLGVVGRALNHHPASFGVLMNEAG